MAAIIDQEKCIHCKTCYDRCPEESFGINARGEIYVQYPEECWLCGACEMDCPAGAIEVHYEINAGPMFVPLH